MFRRQDQLWTGYALESISDLGSNTGVHPKGCIEIKRWKI